MITPDLSRASELVTERPLNIEEDSATSQQAWGRPTSTKVYGLGFRVGGSSSLKPWILHPELPGGQWGIREYAAQGLCRGCSRLFPIDHEQVMGSRSRFIPDFRARSLYQA